MDDFNTEAVLFNHAVDSRLTFLGYMQSLETGIHTEQRVQIHNSTENNTIQKKTQKNKNNQRGNRTLKNKIQKQCKTKYKLNSKSEKQQQRNRGDETEKQQHYTTRTKQTHTREYKH